LHKGVRDLSMQPYVEEHRKILIALQERNPQRTRNAMHTHISNAKEQDMSVLD